ncbi:hypothetical protein FJT64_018626 [Amphibalanus amphitrite]|uniref:G-protein coupled receptors family 1 profile domain-containing protein n=1 Tax=Amphibalanus amphitrite TaxID=1232801 RepID=A0A6A4X7M3_AMPAM|nr:hypothetical protein FJT64_018626 [Amphibalanus amphitrite]
MVYVLVKIAVGAILMVDYSIPLLIVLLRRSLWDEPMVLLVANLCALNFAFGLSLSSIGLLDLVWQPPPAVPCAVIMASSAGGAVSVKLTHVALALDQYLAISRPLHYYPRMEPIAAPFALFSWAWAALHTAAGLAGSLAGLETSAQRVERLTNATSPFTGCRWERVLPGAFMMVSELEVFLSSVCTCSIFIYAGYVGWREKQRMEAARAPSRRDRPQPEESFFLANFSAFKRVLRLMLLVLTVDVVGSVLRLSSPWYPAPQLNGLVHQLRLSLGVVEGWVYGLQNGKMRAAYREALGCCGGRWLRAGGRVMPQQPGADPEPPEERQERQDGEDDRRPVYVISLSGRRGRNQSVEEVQEQGDGPSGTAGPPPSVAVIAWSAANQSVTGPSAQSNDRP